jgi:hypothetical protein
MPEPTSRPDDARAARWVVLRTAPDQLNAEIWCGLLEAEGIPATLAAGDAVAFLGVSPTPCRVMVPEAFLAAAERVLDGEPWAADADDASQSGQ